MINIIYKDIKGYLQISNCNKHWKNRKDWSLIPTKKKLLSYNTIKHPEVTAFFDSLEDGVHSYYMREAIKLYMQHMNNGSVNPFKNALEGNKDLLNTNRGSKDEPKEWPGNDE